MISQYINSCVSIMLFSLLTHIPILSLNETNIMSIGNSSISKTAINIDMRYLSQHLSSCVPTRNTSNQTTASIIKNVPNLLFSCSKHETRTKQLYDRKVKYCFYIFSDKTDNVSTLWRSGIFRCKCDINSCCYSWCLLRDIYKTLSISTQSIWIWWIW